MRNWIILTLVFVFLIGVWSLYWHYDTKHFIQNLPKAPSPTQDLEVLPAIGPTTDISVKQEEPLVDTPSDTPSGAAKSPDETAEAPAVLFFQDVTIEQEPEPSNTELSPELEVLFLGVSLFREDILEVITDLNPMINENISIMFRQQEISRELSSTLDNETEEALYEERAALLAREKELSPRIFVLQDQRGEIEEERNIFLTEYGISSWQEFKEIHGDVYQTWKIDQ